MMGKKTKESNQIQFQEGDIVAAKVKGHPTWPGTIVGVEDGGKKKKYTVKFFYTSDIASSFQDLKPIDQMTASERSCKRPTFKYAMEACEERMKISLRSPVRTSQNSVDDQGESIKKARNQNKTKIVKKVLFKRSPDSQTDDESISVQPEENNNAENKEHDEKKSIRQSEEEPKFEDSLKNCSLNDLTSEQANADRGNKPQINKTIPMQATKRELTLAKLKRKIDTKLEEKKQKKEAFKQQKSFEKASKGLPTLRRKFQPLYIWSDYLLKHIEDIQAAHQVKTSINECEKYLESLAKCLKLMHSQYGAQKKECFDFHSNLRQIVIALKEIEGKETLPVARNCTEFLNKLRQTDGIKKFINSMKFPLFSDAITERKENSKVDRKHSVR